MGDLQLLSARRPYWLAFWSSGPQPALPVLRFNFDRVRLPVPWKHWAGLPSGDELGLSGVRVFREHSRGDPGFGVFSSLLPSL